MEIKTEVIRYVIGELIDQYVFQKNTEELRLEIRLIIEYYLNGLNLYDFIVICDESNNPTEKVNKGILKVDIAIKFFYDSNYIYVPIVLQNALL